jgi:predicted PurR-regulated permease PerM
MKNILIPFVLSFVVAYVLNSFIAYFESFGLKRNVIIILFYILVIAVVGFLINIFAKEIYREIITLRNSIPFYIDQAKNYFKFFTDYISKNTVIVDTLKNLGIGIDDINFNEIIFGYIEKMPKRIMGLVPFISLLFAVPFISFFMLLGWKRVIRKIFDIIPSKYIETSLSLFSEMNSVLGRYIRGQLLDAFFVGVLSIVGLYILGVDHAITFGVIAGIGNIVPYLGPTLGCIPAVIVVMVKTHSIIACIKVIVLFVIIQFIDNHFMTPFIVGRSVKINPVLVLFSLLVGAKFFGVIGLLLAVPTFCILKIIFSIMIKYSLNRNI